ncbi:MAG: hypothetical protein RLZZ461_292 [Planctomycetota bacterium]
MSDRSTMSRNHRDIAREAGLFHGPALREQVLVVLVGILTVFPILWGCGEEKGRDEAVQGQAPRRLANAPTLMEPGDDLFEPAGGSGRAGNDAPAAGSGGRWSIVLATAGGDTHPVQAAALRQQIASEYPQLRTAFVRPQGRGSAIWFGRFESPTDPAAIRAKEMIRGLQRGGVPAFPRAFLSVLPDDAPVGERDIRNLRMLYPNVDPLYSLEVALWWTGGSDQITFDEVRRSAEAYVAELRRAGQDAWYYHDPIKEMSAVTVGVFDKRAYDGRSTLYSPEVDALMKQFPVRRMNGEELMIEVTPGDPRSRIPQACRLVSVPALP